jgi:hypothetical protein
MPTPRRSPRHLAVLTALTVVLGTLQVPASAQPPEFGAILGLFSGPAGPVASVRVVAHSLTNPFESVVTRTGPAGRFELRPVAGRYKLSFQPPPPLLDQWGSGKESEWAADIITVEAGKEIVYEEKALPTGRIEGRLIDAAGQPVFAGVAIENPSLDRTFQATSNADGVWFATVRPGTYTVRFNTLTQVQWAHEKTTIGTADPVTVLADRTTVVNEKLVPTGSLTVEAVDSRSGAPLTTFCAEAFHDFMFTSACTGDGVAEFPKIGAGTFTVKVSDGDHLDSRIQQVRVNSGEATATLARLRHPATIAMTITDAVTGEPVGGLCVNGQPAHRPAEFGGFVGGCADFSGTLTINRVVPDTYTFFASVFDGRHGSQWVGPQGGVGSQAEAAAVVAAEGETTELAIRLDGAGTLAGVVTDEVTGLPVAGVNVSAGFTGGTTEPDGSYLISGLGPYRWVVLFGGQWSGGGANRFAAEPIPVRANESTRYDVALRKGSTLTGRIFGPAGQPPDFAEVHVINAKTFDQMSVPEVAPDGTFTATLLGGQEVKLHVIASAASVFVVMWYPDGLDFAQGQAIPIPDSGTVALDIPITAAGVGTPPPP